jgi:gliding motility-associated-like protein
MMLLNSIQGTTDKVLYIDTLKELLCPGTLYQFSARMLNASIPANCNSPQDHFPSFSFSIETVSGKILQYADTGPMVYDYSMDFTPKFHFYHVDLILPSGIDQLVLKIKNNASVYTPCLYPVALDDIQFTAVGPQSKIAFDGAVGTELIKSICFQDNKTISLSGKVGIYYSNTSLQWEQSTDSGITWTDVPGATTEHYSGTFSMPDTFFFRLAAGEKENISNTNCRVVSDYLTVQVNGIPAEFNATSNSPVCAGSQLLLNATGGDKYSWTGPNGFYDDIAFPHIYFSSLKDSGMYYVNVITMGGCRASDSTYVKIIGTEVIAGPDTSVCKGRSVQLNSSSGISYSWSPAEGLSNAAVRNPVATPDVSTIYTVKVTDNVGCSDTAQVRVKVINGKAIRAGIAGSAFLCRSYDSAFFVNTSTGEIIKWAWNFGNGQTDTSSSPRHQYYSILDNEKSYTVSLAISDSVGCTDTAFYVIKVVDNCYIAVPAAFTPNNDGLNDYLYPLNAYKATQLFFRVYNRKGLLIFETKDWTKKWDGTFHGQPQDSGAYIWTLQYHDEQNKMISLKGTTVLIR